MDKTWKNIFDKYEVSNYGDVRNKVTGKTLSQSINNGYYRVGLTINKKVVVRSVHSLVALGFFGERAKDSQGYPFVVNHKDGNKLNNNIENLEYISTWDNTTHYHAILKPKGIINA